MKSKYLVFFSLLFLFIGCEKDFDSLVDVKETSFSIRFVSITDTLVYNSIDSTLTIRVGISNQRNISKIVAAIFNPSNKVILNNILLQDDGLLMNADDIKGDSIYSARVPFSEVNISGNYRAEIYVYDKDGREYLSALKTFYYDNAQENLPPVVSELVCPDSITIGEVKKIIKITLKVVDPNGYDDIDRVFFNSFIPPNGNPSVSNPFLMRDDGLEGDDVAFDGIFTLIVELPPVGVTKGIYRWEFEALDKRKKLSNKIVHNILVQ